MSAVRPTIKEVRKKFFGGPCPGFGCGVILSKESIMIFHWKHGHFDVETQDNPPALGVSAGDMANSKDRAGG